MSTTVNTPSPPKPWEGKATASSAPVSASNIQNSPSSTISASNNGVSQNANNHSNNINNPMSTSAQNLPIGTSGQTILPTTGSSSFNANSTAMNAPLMGGYSTGYGANPYGAASYGGGYGNNMGMGMNMMSPYGGYGGGYGGMGMMGGGMGMGMMPPMTNMGMMLGHLHQTMGSLGQISELLGMNADALQFMLHGGMTFLERVGFAGVELFNFATGRVDMAQYQNQVVQSVDPQTGQPIQVQVPPPTEEEIKTQRRQRVRRAVIGIGVLLLGYKLIRYLIWRAYNQPPPKQELFNKAWGEASLPQNAIATAQNSFQKPANPNGNNLSLLAPPMGMNNSPYSYGGYNSMGMNSPYGYGSSGYGMGMNMNSPYGGYNNYSSPYGNTPGSSGYGSPYGSSYNSSPYGPGTGMGYSGYDDLF